MEYALIAVAVIVVLFILPKMSRGIESRACAVFDAFNANVIFDRMSSDEKLKALSLTEARLRSAGMNAVANSISADRNDIKQYCYMAYALADQGISPIPPEEKWHLIDKPGLALMSQEAKVREKISHARNVFKNKYGFDVTLSYE